MKHFKKLTIALLTLLSVSAGAWAQTEELLVTINASSDFTSGSKTFGDIATVTLSSGVSYIDNTGWFNNVSFEKTLTVAAANDGYTVTRVKFFTTLGEAEDTTAPFEAGMKTAYAMVGGSSVQRYQVFVNGNRIGAETSYNYLTKIEVYGYQNATPIEVSLNSDKTIATMTMPESDVTVSYDLVRDIQDETYPVAFGGITPTADGTSTKLIVKKGDDGKYQFAEELNITLDDPLISGDNKNIIAADGITVKVLKGDDSTGPVKYDRENPITLEAFLANPEPGFYWIQAVATDDGPYEGTIYSPEMWLIEKYDLAIQPADDFSKGKLDAVTVGGTAVTLDADGKATTTAQPAQEVKLKAKRGYVIEEVKVEKPAAAPAISFSKQDWAIASSAPANFISVSQADAKAAADAEKTRANAPGYVCIYALEGGSYKWFDSHGRSGQGSIEDIANGDAWDEVYECHQAGDSNSIWFTVSQ